MVMVSNWSMVSALLVLVMCGDGLQFACYLSTLVGDILLVALSGNQVMPSDPWLPGLIWECFVFFNLPHPLVSPPSSCRISVFYYYLNSMVFSVFNISFSTFSIAYSLSKAHSCSQDLWFRKLSALLKTCKCFLIASARKPRCHRLYLNPLWVTWSKSLDVQPSIS